jgi:glycosyltransferase involved in cell wall biosynthesis
VNTDFTPPDCDEAAAFSSLAEPTVQKNGTNAARIAPASPEILEAACPICATVATAKRAATPYWVCGNCDAWFQHPMPPKVYEAAHELPGDLMSERERAINDALAGWLVDHVLGGKPGPALDIGSKFPYLSSRLKARGCQAYAMDDAAVTERAHADVLGVPVLRGDFERDAHYFLPDGAPYPYRLITLVHCFEHFYDPVAAIRKLRASIQDDGRVFIRLPDHGVKGIERDLTPGHFSIHPYVHTLSSILEILAQVHDCFVVDETTALEPGQRDIVLRPITAAPTIALGMIARNEERDIPKVMLSAGSAVDAAVLIDTGSTDGTIRAASEAFPHRDSFSVRVFTKASKRDDAGIWKLQDFSRARNEFVYEIEHSDADWLLWLDADDELLTPRVIRRATYDWSHDVYGMWIQSGGSTWVTHRMWKTGRGIHFAGRCHEYPVLGDARVGMLPTALIRHDATPGAGEDSNARNLRILLAEWAENPNPRTAFYLANTHKDAGRWTDAITWYNHRIDFGAGYRDEWLFAWLYRARAERAAGLLDAADATCIIAGDQAPEWMEFPMERAQVAYQRGDYPRAIELASRCVGKPVPPTQLWREVDKYSDGPLRLISWCYEHQGKIGEAIEFGEKAKALINGPDVEWDDRLARLRNASGPFVHSQKQSAIALCRPGAIGDILMTLNLIPALRDANPELQVHYFCAPKWGAHDALGGIMRAAGVDLIMDCAAWPQW